MKVAFRHGTDNGANGSYLIRFTPEKERDANADVAAGGNPVVLVDSGAGVNPDKLLSSTDRLVAVLITHAHYNQIQYLTKLAG